MGYGLCPEGGSRNLAQGFSPGLLLQENCALTRRFVLPTSLADRTANQRAQKATSDKLSSSSSSRLRPSLRRGKLSSNSGERSVGVLEFCALSELHPATAGVGLLLVNGVNQGGIADWSKHCHPDSDEDGSRGGMAQILWRQPPIRVNSRAFAVGLYLRQSAFICGCFVCIRGRFSQDPNRMSKIPTAAPSLVAIFRSEICGCSKW